MSGSITGKNFSIATWAIHGKALVVVLTAVRRDTLIRGRYSKGFGQKERRDSSPSLLRRRERDHEILSGVFEGRTTGTPISLYF